MQAPDYTKVSLSNETLPPSIRTLAIVREEREKTEIFVKKRLLSGENIHTFVMIFSFLSLFSLITRVLTELQCSSSLSNLRPPKIQKFSPSASHHKPFNKRKNSADNTNAQQLHHQNKNENETELQKPVIDQCQQNLLMDEDPESSDSETDESQSSL
jgi:hypothetical protein